MPFRVLADEASGGKRGTIFAALQSILPDRSTGAQKSGAVLKLKVRTPWVKNS